MQYLNVKPKIPGSIVRCPDGSILPESGKKVTRNSFWSRRVKKGDVVCVGNEPSAPSVDESKSKNNTSKKSTKKQESKSGGDK